MCNMYIYTWMHTQQWSYRLALRLWFTINHYDRMMNTLRDRTPWVRCTTAIWCMLMGTLRLINLSWADSFQAWLSSKVKSFQRKLKCLWTTEQPIANAVLSIQKENIYSVFVLTHIAVGPMRYFTVYWQWCFFSAKQTKLNVNFHENQKGGRKRWGKMTSASKMDSAFNINIHF